MPTRRTVLKAVLATGAATVLEGAIPGLRIVAAGALPVRRSLHGMALDDPDLAAYREFVAQMLGASDPRVSWLGFSLQHGSAEGSYKYCPHQDWYFLPWHRAYVQMYEVAVRALTGHEGFAMPFWDWTVDRTVPQAFTEPTYRNKKNPLYTERTLDDPDHWPLPDPLVGPDTMENIYSEPYFPLFGTGKYRCQADLDPKWVPFGGGIYGGLEAGPHNMIHNWLGGFMGTAGSPRDPLFQMHHCNLDRIWATWNARGGSNVSEMPDDMAELWLGMTFVENFIGPNGDLYSARVQDLQDHRALGYDYADLPAAPRLAAAPERNRKVASFLSGPFGCGAGEESFLRLTPSRAVATPDRPLVEEVELDRKRLDQVVAGGGEGKRGAEVFALLRDLSVSPEVAGIKVFVDAEGGEPNASFDDPRFVTLLSFLRHGAEGSGEGHHSKAPASALVNLTPVLRRLAKLGRLQGDTISLHLVPVLHRGAAAARARVVPASVEIALIG